MDVKLLLEGQLWWRNCCEFKKIHKNKYRDDKIQNRDDKILKPNDKICIEVTKLLPRWQNCYRDDKIINRDDKTQNGY